MGQGFDLHPSLCKRAVLAQGGNNSFGTPLRDGRGRLAKPRDSKGNNGRRGSGGAHAVDVAPRTLEGCLGSLFRRPNLGLPDRGSGIQVQPDGRCGSDRHPSAPAGGVDAPGAPGCGGPFFEALADLAELDLPPQDENRIHSWHLFPIRLRLERLSIDRNAFIEALKDAGVGCSVHWRPLHLHTYYEETVGWRPEDCPVATEVWERLVSLPIFPGMREDEIAHVASTVKSLCRENRKILPREARVRS